MVTLMQIGHFPQAAGSRSILRNYVFNQRWKQRQSIENRVADASASPRVSASITISLRMPAVARGSRPAAILPWSRWHGYRSSVAATVALIADAGSAALSPERSWLRPNPG
jgi:hypothetical protein